MWWAKVALNKLAITYLLCGNGDENHELWAGFFVVWKIISTAKRVKSVSDSMSYVLLKGSWCDIVVLDMHAPMDYETDDRKGIFCE
jgi:hypothetical protein